MQVRAAGTLHLGAPLRDALPVACLLEACLGAATLRGLALLGALPVGTGFGLAAVDQCLRALVPRAPLRSLPELGLLGPGLLGPGLLGPGLPGALLDRLAALILLRGAACSIPPGLRCALRDRLAVLHLRARRAGLRLPAFGGLRGLLALLLAGLADVIARFVPVLPALLRAIGFARSGRHCEPEGKHRGEQDVSGMDGWTAHERFP
jgi:hypothetical protein